MAGHVCRALVTVTGAHPHSQEALSDQMKARLEGRPDPDHRGRLVGFVYAQSGIRQRHVEIDPEGADRRKDWIRVVNEATRTLAERTLRRLRAEDPEGVAACDAFVVVTTSHVGFPSLSRVLLPALEIPLDAHCYDLSGLGCAGPTQGLHLAHTLLQQDRHNVILLFVDTMASWSMCQSFDEVPGVNEVVAHCLASDGAAAMVLSRQAGATWVYRASSCTLATKMWSDALDQNDFTAGPAGRPYLSVGKDIRTRLVQEAGELFDADVVSHPLLLHPGGPDLMKRLSAAVPGIEEPVDTSLSVLRSHGNLGSASVLFVMKEWMRRGGTLEPGFRMFALGPGIVTTMWTVDGVEVPWGS